LVLWLKDPGESQIAGFSNRLRSQIPTLDDSRCTANRIGDCSKQRCRCTLNGASAVHVQYGSDVLGPLSTQLINSCPKSIDCVMHVENVFRALIAIPSAVNEYLLHKETDGICDLDSCVVCEWEAVARRQSTAPGSGQENLN